MTPAEMYEVTQRFSRIKTDAARMASDIAYIEHILGQSLMEQIQAVPVSAPMAVEPLTQSIDRLIPRQSVHESMLTQLQSHGQTIRAKDLRRLMQQGDGVAISARGLRYHLKEAIYKGEVIMVENGWYQMRKTSGLALVEWVG